MYIHSTIRYFVFMFLLSFVFIAHAQVSPGFECDPNATYCTYQYACNDGLLHLNTEDASPGTADLYLVGINGDTVRVNNYTGDFRQALAADTRGVVYSISNIGNRRVLTRLNPDGTTTCIPNADCSVGTGIPGSIESFGFRFDNTLFAIDVNSETLYTIDINTGLAAPYYAFGNVGGGNAADGVFAIDFAGGDHVISSVNQLIYVRFNDGAVYRINLNDPRDRVLLGNLPNGSYTSLASGEVTFYAFERNNDLLQPFEVTGNVLNILPAIPSALFGTGDSSSCPQPAIECGNTNKLLNGGFEAVDGRLGLVANRPLNSLNVGGQSWDIYDTLPDVTNGVGLSWFTDNNTSGIEIEYNGTVVNAIGGVHYVELDSHPNAENGNIINSAMSQNVNLGAGDYLLTFWYRPRTRTVNDNPIDILLDDNLWVTADGVDISQWVYVTVPFQNLSVGQHKITFFANGIANQLGGFLDNVCLVCEGDNCGEPPPPPCVGDDCPCVGDNCSPPPCVGDNCPCVGDDCPEPCSEVSTDPACNPIPCVGDNCPPPPCEGDDCLEPCSEVSTDPACNPIPCEGDNCPPPPCEGNDCPPPPCVGDNCPCEGADCQTQEEFVCEGAECQETPCVGDGCGENEIPADTTGTGDTGIGADPASSPSGDTGAGTQVQGSGASCSLTQGSSTQMVQVYYLILLLIFGFPILMRRRLLTVK